MDANQLLFYLRGFCEHVPQPSDAQWRTLQNAILSAKPVETKGCGCGGKTPVPMELMVPPATPR